MGGHVHPCAALGCSALVFFLSLLYCQESSKERGSCINQQALKVTEIYFLIYWPPLPFL